ncbi:hypothetical protein QQF64_033214 [Cirrhinus molitorella]|uniref:Uncharacterized protein n=1 Tax=Cirrhinus molitorella TaxID=172907 RepID=A0ABR3MT99_9TELE
MFQGLDLSEVERIDDPSLLYSGWAPEGQCGPERSTIWMNLKMTPDVELDTDDRSPVLHILICFSLYAPLCCMRDGEKECKEGHRKNERGKVKLFLPSAGNHTDTCRRLLSEQEGLAAPAPSFLTVITPANAAANRESESMRERDSGKKDDSRPVIEERCKAFVSSHCGGEKERALNLSGVTQR